MSVRVIVTGGTGFVGSNLVRRLLIDGHDVHLLVRPNFKSWRLESIHSSVQLHEVDLCKPTLFPIIKSIRPDWIFHLAAYGAYSSQKDLRQMVQTNVLGTMNLVEACLKVGFEAFVNTGSSSEYGLKDQAPSEEELLEPNSHYAITKATATMFCRHTAQKEGAPITTLRLYSVFGPYEEPTRLMPTLILCGLQGKLPPLVNSAVARDFVYIDDVVEACMLVARTTNNEAGSIYNVGSGTQMTIQQVVDTARIVMGIAAKPNWGSMPDRDWDTGIWVSDSQKIMGQLGWRPAYSFKQGFECMVDWFRNHESLREHYHRQLFI